MKKVSISLSIVESSEGSMIDPVTLSFEGERETHYAAMHSAVGAALHAAHRFSFGQYKNPIVTVGGVELTPTETKKLRGKDFFAFRLDLPIIRERLMPYLSASDSSAMLEYVRSTDRNGVHVNTKKVTEEQFLAQAKEQLRLTRDVVRYARQDARESVVTPEIAARRALQASVSKQKRLLAAEDKKKQQVIE